MAIPATLAAALVVVVAGIVFAARPDLWFVAASPSAQPTAPQTDGPMASAISTATPRTGCSQLTAGTTPVLEVNRGVPFRLVVESVSSSEPGHPEDWSEPFRRVADAGNRAAIPLPGAFRRIALQTRTASCLASLRATAVRLDAPRSEPVWDRANSRIDADGSRAFFEAPPVGDWLVRLVTEIPTTAGTTWVESYLRMSVGFGSIDVPTVIEPAVPCGPETADAGLELAVGETAVPGVAPEVGPDGPRVPPTPRTIIPIGATAEIRTVGDRCALAWSMRAARSPGSPEPAMIGWDLPTRDARIRDPRLAAQNRFDLGAGPTGDWDLFATIDYADGTKVSRGWSVRIESPDLPTLQVEVAGTTRRVAAWIGCGWRFELPDGNAVVGADGCTTNLPEHPLETLAVASGSRLTVKVDGWSIGEWWVGSGTFAEPGPFFQDRPDGFLRYASSPPVDVPVPTVVGQTTIKIATLLSRGEDRLRGEWFFVVDVR